jgi:hypothetical protein
MYCRHGEEVWIELSQLANVIRDVDRANLSESESARGIE